MFVFNCQIYVWEAYYKRKTVLTVLISIGNAFTVFVCISFLFRIVQLLMLMEDISNYSHYHNLMSHVIVCIYVIPTFVISKCFGSNPWKEVTEQEFFLYNMVEVCSIVLFFFTSSRIAQRHFVHAKVLVCVSADTHYYSLADCYVRALFCSSYSTNSTPRSRSSVTFPTRSEPLSTQVLLVLSFSSIVSCCF